MMNLSALVLCWLVGLVEPWQANFVLSTSWKPKRDIKNNRRKEDIVIHRIKSPRLDMHYRIDGLELGIHDPELYYDHMAELCGECNNAVDYLATWKDESPIIGMVNVMLHWVTHDDDYEELPIPILRGLWLDDVTTASRYKRKGVGTALFQAIERDASELMKNMTLADHQNYPESIYSVPPHGMIEIGLVSVPTWEALEFYRSMGYQFAPWQDNASDKRQTLLGELARRLKLSWFCFKKRGEIQLVKRLDLPINASLRSHDDQRDMTDPSQTKGLLRLTEWTQLGSEVCQLTEKEFGFRQGERQQWFH